MAKRAFRRPVLLGVAALLIASPLVGQARPPLTVAADSTGVLSAIRAVDLRQLCRCPQVVLDSTVRISRQVRVYDVLQQPAAGVISAADAGKLQLAGRRASRSAFRFVTRRGPDSVFVAVQLVPPLGARRRVLMVATPPNGITSAYLVSLEQHRGRWRVMSTTAVLDP